MPSHSTARYVLLKAPTTIIRHIVPILNKFTHPTPPPPDEATHYPTPRGNRAIHIYLPSQPHDGPLPVHISLQGSGFSIPAHGSDGIFCRRTADAVPCVVLDVDHSHAPEHPFPAALEDIVEAVRWLDAVAEQRGWDRTRVSIGGFSSGGNLALSASAMEGLRGRFEAVVAVYPSTNLAQNPSSKPPVKPAKGATGSVVPAPVRKLFYANYVAPGTDRRDPRISCLHAEPDWFPASTTIVTCGGDSLAKEANELVDKLRKAGRDVESFEAPGQGHAWDLAVKDGDSEPARLRDEAYALVARRLGEALRG